MLGRPKDASALISPRHTHVSWPHYKPGVEPNLAQGGAPDVARELITHPTCGHTLAPYSQLLTTSRESEVYLPRSPFFLYCLGPCTSPGRENTFG